MNLENIKTPVGFLNFYQTVCACPCTSKECPNTINNSQEGIPPRGFYTLGTPRSVKLLIVGKNPGHLLDNERKLYLNQTARQMVETQFNLIHQIFQGCHQPTMRKNRSLTFHRNLLRYFSYFLDIPVEQVFHHCAYTNLVKCQTLGEQDKLHKTTMANCFERHFSRELEYFQPKVLVALGGEVYQMLSKASLEIPIIKIKHPSYYYSKEDEAEILQGIKREIQAVIA